MQRTTLFNFPFVFITITLSINANSLRDILKEVGSIAQSENLSPSCFIMHADQEEPAVVNFHQEIINLMGSAGLKVLYASQGDHNGLPIGGNIQEYMRLGILKSDFIFALYSPKFFERSTMPMSGISTEIHILTERFASDTLTCFIPIIIPGTLDTSVPYCLRDLLASQSPAEGMPFSVEMFTTDLLHLLYYRIFSNSKAIQNLLRSVIEKKSPYEPYQSDNHPAYSTMTICMSSLGSIPENHDTTIISMSSIDGTHSQHSIPTVHMSSFETQNTQFSIPTVYMSSIGSNRTPESQDNGVTLVG